LVLLAIIDARVVLPQPGGPKKMEEVSRSWRIAERTLFLPVVLFGSLGGTLGMFCFHHKTKHWYFRYGFPLDCFASPLKFVELYRG